MHTESTMFAWRVLTPTSSICPGMAQNTYVDIYIYILYVFAFVYTYWMHPSPTMPVVCICFYDFMFSLAIPYESYFSMTKNRGDFRYIQLLLNCVFTGVIKLPILNIGVIILNDLPCKLMHSLGWCHVIGPPCFGSQKQKIHSVHYKVTWTC